MRNAPHISLETLVSRQGNGLNGQLAIAVHPGEEGFWLTFSSLPSNLAVYTADCDASGDLILMDCGKVGSKKEPLFFALVCINPRYLQGLKALKANEAVYRHFARAKAFCVGASDPTAILAAILAELGSFTGRIANYAADNLFALSAMRRDYENLHLRFSALESYLQRSGAQLVRERLFIPPALTLDGSLLVEAAEGSSFQVLPVGSKGLCAIDIFVAFIDCGVEEGSVEISLLLGDGKEPVTTWTIKPEGAKASAGAWRSLALACAIEGINKTAILKIELQGLEPSKVKFGVSKLNPNRAYCWSDVESGKPVVDRPLALRIWEAPPGLRVPHVPNILLGSARDPASEGGRRVPAHALKKCRPIYDGWRPDFEAVEYLSDHDAVGVHPPDVGVCVGVLDRIVPPAAVSVSATAFLGHENALPVEFALAVFDSLEESDGVADGEWSEFRLLRKPLAWSGWRGVERLNSHQLTVIMPSESRRRDQPLSMAMLTRMENGRHNGFAWARFTDVRIEEID